MKIKSIATSILFGAVCLFLSAPAPAGDLFAVRRVRTVPNPVPGLVPGEELLEVTFRLNSPGWVGGVGWSLRYYDREKQLLDASGEAFIEADRNNLSRVRGRYLKGETVFTLLFPLREDADYLVLTLGDGVRRKVILYPYTALLEDFLIPIGELSSEIARSRLAVLKD